MKFCSKCSKQNPDKAKFCTGCGSTLSILPDTSSPTDQSFKHEKITAKVNWTIILSLGIIIIAVFAYFIFFNNREKSEKPSIGITPVVDTMNYPVSKVKESEPVPLKPASKEPDITITEFEVENVSRRLDEFYTYETKEDVTNLLSYYRFPLDQYYQLYNVSYEKLHKMVVEAFNGKLYYHNIKINWNYSSVQKISTGGYKAILSAEYTSASKSNDDRKTRNIHLTILMNNNYEITSIYPN